MTAQIYQLEFYIKLMQIISSRGVASELVAEIVGQAERAIHFNELIRTKLSHYCCQQSLKYSGVIYNQSSRQPQTQYQTFIQKQPNALIQDNFFPTAAAIDQPVKVDTNQQKSVDKKDKKMLRNNTQQSLSQISLGKKVSKQQAPSPYYQLELPPNEEEEAILKELRKQVQEESNKLAQSSVKKTDQKGKKKQGKQQRVSFDYNGEAIPLRSENRNNLISGGLGGETLKTVEKLKQANKKVDPTEIEYERKDKKLVKLARNNQVQFTDIKTLLSDAKATKGIKITEEGRVIQEKKRIIPVKELMKTLTGRKLTKDDYKRIKQVSGNVAPFDDYSNTNKSINTITTQKNEPLQNLSQIRSGSQSKLSNPLSRRRSTITVNDGQLLSNLIQVSQNEATYKSSDKNEEENKEEKLDEGKFDSNDYYNLQYMKKGGSMGIKKSKSTADLVDIKLPKIETSRQEMPRVREKLKDKQEIVRAIRKKFEQKLRT